MQTLYTEDGVEGGCGGMVRLHDGSQNWIINEANSVLKSWTFFPKIVDIFKRIHDSSKNPELPDHRPAYGE